MFDLPLSLATVLALTILPCVGHCSTGGTDGGSLTSGRVHDGGAGRVLGAQETGGQEIRGQGPVEAGTASEDFADQRRALRQPGPEARAAREAAVEDLVRRPERAAHDALCEVLTAAEEFPFGLRDHVLEVLARQWRQRRDPVFGDDNKARFDLHRRYAIALVEVFEGGDAPIASIEREPARHHEQNLVWECFRALTPLDRRRVFEALADPGQPTVWRAAMWAMAGSRDLGLAPLIADGLAHGAGPRATAIAALPLLTFVETSFRTRPEFDAWYAEHRDAVYLDLAEAAARRVNSALQERIRSIEADLIGALAANETVDWKKLAETLRGDGSAAAGSLYLTRLRDVLVRKNELGGLVEDRLALVRELQSQLDVGQPAAQLGLRLEVLARLVKPGETEYALTIERLVAGLDHSESVVRAAALRGLANHYSMENRRLVVTAARQALRDRDDEILGVALECLARRTWNAPAEQRTEDVAAWIALLDELLRPSADLPARFQDQAIQVLVQQTADKTRLPQAYDLLIEATGAERGLPTLIRKQAIARLRLFTDNEARADRYVNFVSGLMADADPEIREAAARELRELPDGTRKQRDEWTRLVVARAGDRLAHETMPAPMRAAVDCLSQLAGSSTEDPTNVIGKFRTAVDAYLARPAADRPAFQRELLVNGLKQLGAVPNRSVAQWTAAAEGLAKLEDRGGLRFVLDRQNVANVAETDPAALRAWTLVIDAALLKPLGAAWSEYPAEAGEVSLAFERLEKLGALPVESKHRRLRVVAAVAAGNFKVALTRANELLDSPTANLEPADRDAVMLAKCEALLVDRKLDEADQILASLNDLVPAERAHANELRVKLATQRIERSEFESAVELMRDVLATTPVDSPHYPSRVLVAFEARYRRDPRSEAAPVLLELRALASVFDREATSPELRERYQALITAIEKGEGS